jgi:hypothetical protein
LTTVLYALPSQAIFIARNKCFNNDDDFDDCESSGKWWWDSEIAASADFGIRFVIARK